MIHAAEIRKTLQTDYLCLSLSLPFRRSLPRYLYNTVRGEGGSDRVGTRYIEFGQLA